MRELWVSVFALACAVLVGCDDNERRAERADAGADAALESAGPAEDAEDADAATDADAEASASEAGMWSSPYAEFANTLPVEAIFLGVCAALSRATDPKACTGLDEVLDCSKKQCDFDGCAATCKDHIECMRKAADRCPSGTACPYGDACLTCSITLAGCVWTDRCKGLYRCATPSAEGPCAKVEACCKTQRNPANCLGWLEGETMLGGDEGCAKLLTNTGFMKVFANDPPCMLAP